MKRLFIVLSVCLVAATAFAQTPPELKKAQAFIGTWDCTGMAYKSDFGPEHPIKMTVVSKWGLDGQWLITDYTEAKTAKNPKPMKGISLWGYDSEIKKLVAGWVDSTGAYQTSQSDGWNGDTIVFAGPMHGGGMTMTGRDTFVKKSAHQIDHVFDMQDKSGNWTKMESDTCHKRS